MVLRLKKPPALKSPLAFIRISVRSQIPSSPQTSGVLIHRPLYLPMYAPFALSFPQARELVRIRNLGYRRCEC